MIDEMTALRDLRPEVTEPDQLTVLRARRTVLRTALARRRRRRVGRIAIAGLVTAAATALVVGVVGPGSNQPAVATQLASAHLALHPEVGRDEYLHIRRVERMFGYGPKVKVQPFTLEYWIPGDRTSAWTERSGMPGDLEDNTFDEWGPRLYVDHADDPAALLDQLRDYAEKGQLLPDEEPRALDPLEAVWTAAFWIVNDPVAPESFKTEVMNAVAGLPGVRVADADFTSPGLSGRALTRGERYPVWFVVDPQTGAFRGLVGHPEKDRTWVGPDGPMWTTTFETSVAAEAP